MKVKKIFRPEIEVEYVGVKGFLSALCTICKVGIRKATLNIRINAVSGYAGKVEKHTCYAIPKYKFKKVSELTKNEVECYDEEKKEQI